MRLRKNYRSQRFSQPFAGRYIFNKVPIAKSLIEGSRLLPITRHLGTNPNLDECIDDLA